MIAQMWVLAQREFQREWNEKGKLIFDIAWPLMVLAVLGFGVDAFAPQKTIETSYVAFLGPGLIGLLALRYCIGYGRSLEYETRIGFREYLVTPVPRILIVLGTMFGMFCIQLVTMVIIFAVYAGVLGLTSPVLLGKSSAFLVLAVLLALSIGLLLAMIIGDLRKHPKATSLGVIAITLLSGVFFPITDLPFGLYQIALFSPLTHLCDGLRWAAGVPAIFDGNWQLLILAIIVIVCFIGGLIGSKKLFVV